MCVNVCACGCVRVCVWVCVRARDRVTTTYVRSKKQFLTSARRVAHPELLQVRKIAQVQRDWPGGHVRVVVEGEVLDTGAAARVLWEITNETIILKIKPL
jgi:hypothetical protein